MEALTHIFNIIIQDLNYIHHEDLLALIIIFTITFIVSYRLKSIISRLIFVLIGLFFLQEWEQESIVHDLTLLVGLSLVLPHIRFIYSITKNTIITIWIFFYHLYQNLKYATINTYYFFITIYYKIIRFIKWINNICNNIITFFQVRKESKNTNSNSSNKEQKNKKGNYSNNKNSYEQQSNHQKYSYKEQHNSPSSNHKETQTNTTLNEFKRFYSDNAYIVLGVSVDDDFSTIKKSYRKLVSEYHPDRNSDKDEMLYTEITQNINEAYEKLKKIKQS